MPALFAELKRRNVIRMAGLYLVGAWLLVQVAGTVLPMFGAPEWMPRTVVVLLALGFVPALVFAWVFEMTPDGIKRDADVPPEKSIASHTAQRMNRLIVATLVLAVIYFCVDKIVLAPRREAVLVASTTQVAKAAATTQATRKARDNSIAVLPFVNMSDDAANQFFSDGISEELLNVLVRVDGLSVASRTSSFAYRDKSIGSLAIARDLGVGHILEGSVRKAGNKVRITAQLIDAVNDRHLWSKTYDRELTDIFAIQDEIANAIVAALRGSLKVDTAAPAVSVQADTGNMEAYEIYLKARELFIARERVDESVRLFEKVVALDPRFARGWEGLAAACAIAESWGFHDRDYTALAESSAKRALELDPGLSMPWAVLSMVEIATLPINWQAAMRLHDKSVAADPKNATAYLWRAISWSNLGFFDRAEADLDRCIELDPSYHNCVRWKAVALLNSGKTDAALALFEQGVAAGFIANRSAEFLPALVRRGDRLAAELLMASFSTKPKLNSVILDALVEPALPNSATKALANRRLIEDDISSDQSIGTSRYYLWLGAYDLVATSPDIDGDSQIAWDRSQPAFRNSAGFKAVLAKLGVPAYWRANGYPPQCRAAGGEDFVCDPIQPDSRQVAR
jgi:TolB-like protein